MQTADDIEALQRLGRAKLLAAGHQPGHFLFGEHDFLAAPLGEREIGHLKLQPALGLRRLRHFSDCGRHNKLHHCDSPDPLRSRHGTSRNPSVYPDILLDDPRLKSSHPPPMPSLPRVACTKISTIWYFQKSGIPGHFRARRPSAHRPPPFIIHNSSFILSLLPPPRCASGERKAQRRAFFFGCHDMALRPCRARRFHEALSAPDTTWPESQVAAPGNRKAECPDLA